MSKTSGKALDVLGEGEVCWQGFNVYNRNESSQDRERELSESTPVGESECLPLGWMRRPARAHFVMRALHPIVDLLLYLVAEGMPQSSSRHFIWGANVVGFR